MKLFCCIFPDKSLEPIDEHNFVDYTGSKYTQGVIGMYIPPTIDHDFKNLIPPLSPEEREQLEQNIVTTGKCYDAIVLWEGKIIDGHNRYEICKKHGIEFQIEELQLPSREAAMLWILENQLARRNLTDAMRIEVALMKEGVLRERARKNQSRAGGAKKSGKDSGSLCTKTTTPEAETIHFSEITAATANVGEGTLHRYLEIKQHAAPELLAQVQSGEVKIGTAHRMLTKEILKQLNRADKMYSFIRETISASFTPLPHENHPCEATISGTSQENAHDTGQEGPLTKEALRTSLTKLSAQLQELILKLKENPQCPS